MSRVHWGPVENQVFEDVFATDSLAERVPGIGDVLEGAAQLRDILGEINQVGAFREAAGFIDDGSMQRVAKLDTNLMLFLDDLHQAGCTCTRGLWGSGGHKQWFMQWLETHGKAFDVRGKLK
jgi:hypothetical protein